MMIDQDKDRIWQTVNDYSLDMVQLHGTESVDFCCEINKNLPVIKAFSIETEQDIKQADTYEGSCAYFLFDTKTAGYGGSGRKFDWNLLNKYTGQTPFILSGGISSGDAGAIKKINHPKLYGIDLNSRFETENPGVKDIVLLSQFIKTINDE